MHEKKNISSRRKADLISFEDKTSLGKGGIVLGR